MEVPLSVLSPYERGLFTCDMKQASGCKARGYWLAGRSDVTPSFTAHNVYYVKTYILHILKPALAKRQAADTLML